MKLTGHFALLVSLFSLPFSACASDDVTENINNMASYNINISVNGQTVTATMVIFYGSNS